MAIAEFVDILTTALWPQGDIRDPLGVWGFRHLVTSDATSGGIKVTAQAAAGIEAAYVYTCYALTHAQLTGGQISPNIKARLLTNWPDMDTTAGVRAYATLRIAQENDGSSFTAPVAGLRASDFLVTPNERFLLLFDPRSRNVAIDLVEMELNANVDGDTNSFEGWGYYWDRSVLQAPGGPRHPGSS